jgi:diacylglycerol kinase (ATP)
VNATSNPLSQLPDLILVNPSAGGGRGARAADALRNFIRQSNWHAELVTTANAADLEQRARTAAAKGYKRILALGGDGTFQILLNALALHPDVTLGIIPAGGGNDLAKALGIPRDPIQATAILRDGEPRSIDVVRVRTSNGQERLYAGGGGVGLDADAAHLAATTFANWKGRFRYIAALLHALHQFAPLQVRATIHSPDWHGPQTQQSKVLLLGFLNTPSYGAGLRVAPHAKLDDGKLELLAVADLNALEILALLPALILFSELRSRRIQRLSITRAHIESDPPARFHGDGEILGMTPLEVEILPHFIRVLAPKRHTGSNSS